MHCRKSYKSRKTQFKVGHVPLNKGTKYDFLPGKVDTKYSRLTLDKFTDVVDTTLDDGCFSTHDVHGSPTDTHTLRPTSSRPKLVDKYMEEEINQELSTYRLFHPQKTANLFNSSYKEHIDMSPNCCGTLEFDESREKQWGLCWIEQLKCSTCHYLSSAMKLYEEVVEDQVTRGRKAAAPNVALQVGLSHSMIGNTALRNILLATNIPAPSRSTMQRTANKVGKKLQEVNEEDMKKRRVYLREIHELRGLAPDHPIRAEADCRYNNGLFSGGGKTPFQPATQKVLTLLENSTSSKMIIGIHTANKLCQKGRLEGKKCPQHEGHCSANIAPDDVIGDEAASIEACVQNIVDKDMDPLAIGYLTTDGDSKTVEGLKKVQKKHRPEIDIINLRDTRHFSESQKREIEKVDFSNDMFPGKTKADRTTMQRRFALDLKNRCTGEFSAAYVQHAGDINRMRRSLSYTIDAIIQCYRGNCGTSCRRYSYVCGGAITKCWDKSYLPKGIKLNISDSDEDKLRNCILHRLGKDGLEKTRFNTNTQKTEAVNRSYQRSNPKIVTYSLNFPARVHSAAHLCNNGIGDSTIAKCEALGTPISRASRVARALRSEQIRQNYIAKYQKSPKFKSRRSHLRRGRYWAHDAKKETQNYEKGLLDKTVVKKAAKPVMSKHMSDHTYYKR